MPSSGLSSSDDAERSQHVLMRPCQASCRSSHSSAKGMIASGQAPQV